MKEIEKNIADGETFTCPIHFCCICKQIENKKERELQFAVCRRCPKSYHLKCLPRLLLFFHFNLLSMVSVPRVDAQFAFIRNIAFEDIEEEGIITRAWEGLLPNNRILIYCL